MSLKTTFADYLWAFTSRWSVLMSGPLSVPAAIAAALAPNWVARILLAATALFCFLYSSYWVWRIEREKRNETENELARLNDPLLTGYPNVRVADNPPVLKLFQSSGPERNKLLSYLMRDFISCWARRFTGTSTDLVKVPGSVWNTGWFFDLDTKRQDDEGTINQTLIRENDANRRPMFYDLYLNFAQMKRVWPTIEIIEARNEIR